MAELTSAVPNTDIGDRLSLPHGGDIDAARARFPGAVEPWIDLSTGINPIAYPLPPLPPEAWTRLPTASELSEMLSAARRRYRVPDSNGIAAAPGSQALIQLLPRLVGSARVAVLGPTYQEHAACWRGCGHEVVTVSDLASAQNSDIVIIVNPNNPTGRMFAVDEIAAVASDRARRGGLVVVDEAFADVLDADCSVAALALPATMVLKSFGKTFGLAGVRLGFAIGPAPLVETVQRALGPWAISGAAIVVGEAALSDAAWLAAARVRLTYDAARLDALLVCAGFEIIGGTPLFRLAQSDQAPGWRDRLGCAGIHVRAFDDEPSWLRFGLPGANEAWVRLERALTE